MWTYFLVFKFSELNFKKYNSVNTLRAQLIFPFKPIFCSLFEFPRTKFTQKLISSTPYLWKHEIKSIKSDLPRTFQQHQQHPHILIQFVILILFNFHWKNCSIINGFHTIVPNNLKPSRCTPTHQEFSKDINNIIWNTMVWKISTWQNKLPCFINRLWILLTILMCKL